MGDTPKSLTIETGEIRLLINDDPDNVLTFNPEDVVFAEKVYNLEQEFVGKEGEFLKRAEVLEEVTEKDSFGAPINAGERIAYLKELGEWIRGQIDALFGVGTSQRVFGNLNSLAAYTQFFEGIMPYFHDARSEKVSKYTKTSVIEERKAIEQKKAMK